MGLNRACADPQLSHRSPGGAALMDGAAEHPQPLPKPTKCCHTHPAQLHTSPAATAPEHPHALLLEKPQPREKYSTFQVRILKSSSQAGSPDGFLCMLKAQPAPVPGPRATDGINAAPIYRALIRSSSPPSFYSLYPFIRP